MEYEFTEAPTVGYVHERFGQRYELVKVRPYIRRDRTPSCLLTWLGECADCGAPFMLEEGLRVKSLNRRCVLHISPFKPASAEAKRSRTNGKRRGAARGRAMQKANAKARRELLS